MTALLERAIQETEALSDTDQDFLAALLLENIQDAKQWDAQFAASKDVLEKLFDEATAEYEAGRTAAIKVKRLAAAADKKALNFNKPHERF